MATSPARGAASGHATRETDGTLAAQVALEIQAEIVRMRWPVGQVLGSETDLMRRFHVARCVVREAQQILASRGVARAKRGPGGGLVVTAPNPAVLSDLAGLVFDYRGFSAAHLFEAWAGIEVAVVERLATQITPEGIADLRLSYDEAIGATDFRRRKGSIHAEIARLSGNPIAEVLLHALSDLLKTYCSRLTEDELVVIRRQHVELIDALEAGDGAAASATIHLIFDGLRQGRDRDLAGVRTG